MAQLFKNQLEEDEIEEDTLEDQYLIFSLGERHYGIEIRHITEIVGLQTIAEVPETPSYVVGVMNLRGKIIPLVDARIRLGLEKIPYNDKTCVIIFELEEKIVGLVVDTVKEVLHISKEQMETAPSFQESEKAKFVKYLAKIKEKVKIILDLHTLIQDENVAKTLQKREGEKNETQN